MLNLLAVAGVLGLLHFTKRYFAGAVCKCRSELIGKTVIVTGGNSGIGKSTAAILASRGAVVIIACRNISEGRKASEDIKNISKSQHISCQALDLTSFSSIRAFVDELKNKGVKNIYALINNAGVFYHPFQITENGYEVTFQTNYLGPFLLTNLLLRANLVCTGSRIVNVSSAGHRYARAIIVGDLKQVADPSSWQALDQFARYGESKLYVNLFTLQLASLYKDIVVLSVDPGNVETNVYRHYPLLNNPVLCVLLKPLRLLLVKTPWQGAQTVVHATISEQCIAQSGSYLSDCKPQAVQGLSLNKQLADELWRASLMWCALDS